MFLILLILVLNFLVQSYVQVPLTRRHKPRRSLISYTPYPSTASMVIKQSVDGVDNETKTLSVADARRSMAGVDEAFQDYSKFSSESFSALKNLASASLSIILSGNRINTTTEVTSTEGQNLWSLIDTDVSTISGGKNSSIIWDIYVCQSKSSIERGAVATLEAFQSLAPPNLVVVHPAILGKTKSKGPTVRVIHRDLEKVNTNASLYAFEVNNVDSIDKVYRILTKPMGLSEQDVKPAAKECLKWMYRGNGLMKNTNDQQFLSEAIYCYTAALDTQHPPQRGVLFLLRATAYLQRGFYHQRELKILAADMASCVPSPSNLNKLLNFTLAHPQFSPSVLQQITNDCRVQDKKFREMKYRHGLYEFALLHAAQDALRATQILPANAQAWLRAADALAELRKMRESILYYEKSIQLDSTLETSLRPIIDQLKNTQDFLERARSIGWSEDILRLALDVS